MEEFSLVRCDSLDRGPCSDKELMTPLDHRPLYPQVEPSPAELAQCEAEVGTLLSIIAEVSKKMGSLKAPSEAGDLRPPSPLFPDLLSHRLVRSSPEKNSATDVNYRLSRLYQGGSNLVWTELKGALTAVEDSIHCRRSWAAPIAFSDREKPKEHLRAAQDSWAKASKVLEEMEKEFGISFPSEAAKETFQELVTGKHFGTPPLQAQRGELQRAHSVSHVEEDKSKVGQHRGWRSAVCSPSARSSSITGPLSAERACSSFPNSPLLLRRATGGSLSSGGESSPLSFVMFGSPCQSPVSMETEVERLNRQIEGLKARNEHLTVALERKTIECEQISVTLKRLEADCSAMHLALRYCDECEGAYSELLSLYDTQSQESLLLQTARAGVDDSQQFGNPSPQHREMVSEELSTSFTRGDGTGEVEMHTTRRTPELTDREVALRQLIERLKVDRTAIGLARPRPHQAEVKITLDAVYPAGLRVGHLSKESSKPAERKRDKNYLFHELITAREEMSDLRALIRLKEKELRCLEWSVATQKSQEGSGACISENLQEEPGERKTEQQSKLCSDGDVIGLRTRPILKELQALLHREQVLKKRLSLVYESMNATFTDSKDSDEHVAWIAQAQSKALSSYRHIRRKYREQVWKLEQKLAAMMESQQIQRETSRATGEDSDWKREETIL
ncbi:colorectal mutant cancer protein [Stigmatopora argus]